MNSGKSDALDDDAVDWSHISEVDRIFQYKREAWVLACLHGGPLRHGELLRAITMRMRVPLTATEMGRALNHLIDIDRVEHVKVGRRVMVYRLTKDGATDAGIVVQILGTLARTDTSNPNR